MLSSTYTTDVLAISGFSLALPIVFIVLAVKVRQTMRAVLPKYLVVLLASLSLVLLVLAITFMVLLAIHPGSILWYRFCRVVPTFYFAIPQVLAIYVVATRCQKRFTTAVGLLELAWLVTGAVFFQTQSPMLLPGLGHLLFACVMAEHYVRTVWNSRDTNIFIQVLYWISLGSSVGAAVWAFVMAGLALRHKAIDFPVVTLYVLTILKLVPIMILDSFKDRTRESIPSERPSSPPNPNNRPVDPSIVLDDISKDGAQELIPQSRFSCESRRCSGPPKRNGLLQPIYARLERVQKPPDHILA